MRVGSGGGEAEGGKLRQFRQEYLQPAGRVGQLRGKRGVCSLVSYARYEVIVCKF